MVNSSSPDLLMWKWALTNLLMWKWALTNLLMWKWALTKIVDVEMGSNKFVGKMTCILCIYDSKYRRELQFS